MNLLKFEFVEDVDPDLQVRAEFRDVSNDRSIDLTEFAYVSENFLYLSGGFYRI